MEKKTSFKISNQLNVWIVIVICLTVIGMYWWTRDFRWAWGLLGCINLHIDIKINHRHTSFNDDVYGNNK